MSRCIPYSKSEGEECMFLYMCVFCSKFIFLTPNTELALLDKTTIGHKPQDNMSSLEKDEKKAEAGANERETRQSATHTLSVGACPGSIPGSQAPSVPRVCVFWLGTILRFHPWMFRSQCSGPGLPSPHRCCFN